MAEQSSDEEKSQGSILEEALKILNEEGFNLPDDVVDTLTTAGRSAPTRRKGSLRSHRVCEAQSSTRKVRNVRESGARRSVSGDRDKSDANGSANGYQRNGNEAQRQHQPYQNMGSDNVFIKADDATNNGRSESSSARGHLERELSSESSSTASASTVREMQGASGTTAHAPFLRQDSASSIASSASSLNRKLGQLDDRRTSYGSDPGYNTSIENAKQVHEARAENLKNINKQNEGKLLGKLNTGLKRDLSRDSGFTELDNRFSPGMPSTPETPSTPVGNPPLMSNSSLTAPAVNSAQEFRDVSMSNSDVSERVVSSNSGDANVVTSTSSDMSAAEMTKRSNEITADGTAVSSASKLTNQENELALQRTTVKKTKDEISKAEDFENEHRTAKSSKNDSISTSTSGVTTAASRNAASMEQDLTQEHSNITTSTDGRSISANMSASQQLARHQEVNNVEHADDGSSKIDNKQVTEKSMLSRSQSEYETKNEDGSKVGSMSASQDLKADSKSEKNEENLTRADGTIIKRKNDSTSSSVNEKSVSEQKNVKHSPYGGASSTELTKKEDNSSVSKASSVFNEVNETPTGRSEILKSDNSNSMESKSSGQCESTEVVNGVKLHRTMSSETSSENKMKATKSVSSHSSVSGSGYGVTNDNTVNRRLSNISNSSTLSNASSGLSRDNVKPPTYEETLSNISRQNSRPGMLSRQDSDASSIASSASAFNERQKQKQQAMAGNRGDSFDSVTKLKEVANTKYGQGNPVHSRQNSNSSDSTIGGGDYYVEHPRSVKDTPIYQNLPNRDLSDFTSDRVINHPIRQADQPEYTRSRTDPVGDRRPNRRATLHGDVTVTERELREAREDVRSGSAFSGRDDSFINRNRSNRRNNWGGDSFESEVMSMVDKFFDDDRDDDFGFGGRTIKSTRNVSMSDTIEDIGLSDLRSPLADMLSSDIRSSGNGNTRYDRSQRTSKSSQNPYSARDDLSRLSSRAGSVNLSRGKTDYAASDSGFDMSSGGTSRRLQRNSNYRNDTRDGVFSDSVSESGDYNRHGRSRNDWDNRMSSDLESHYSDSVLTSQQRNKLNNSNQFSNSSSRYTDDDISHRVGKSMNRERQINSSILGGRRHENETRNRITNDNSYSDINDGSVYSGRYADGSVSSRCESDFDMSDAGSTCPSLHSLPPNVHRMRDERPEVDEFRTRSMPDIPNADEQSRDVKDPLWENRRQRIDKALTWIRSELGVLRSQDKVLMSQFQRCQDSIESLKKQRPWYEVFSDDEEEEDRHWEEWEIDEFDRSDRGNNSLRHGTDNPGRIITKDVQ